MKYAHLGKTGLIVSRLSFGVMTFGKATADDPMASVWKTGQEQASALIECALDAGINFFDTADMYAGGQSEEMLDARSASAARTLSSRPRSASVRAMP